MAKKIDEQEIATTFEYNGETYDLRFDYDAIDRFERVSGESLMSMFNRAHGMFSLAQINTLLTLGIVNVSGTMIGSKEKKAVVRAYLEKRGYGETVGALNTAIERDCGFLFQTA